MQIQFNSRPACMGTRKSALLGPHAAAQHAPARSSGHEDATRLALEYLTRLRGARTAIPDHAPVASTAECMVKQKQPIGARVAEQLPLPQTEVDVELSQLRVQMAAALTDMEHAVGSFQAVGTSTAKQHAEHSPAQPCSTQSVHLTCDQRMPSYLQPSTDVPQPICPRSDNHDSVGCESGKRDTSLRTARRALQELGVSNLKNRAQA